QRRQRHRDPDMLDAEQHAEGGRGQIGQIGALVHARLGDDAEDVRIDDGDERERRGQRPKRWSSGTAAMATANHAVTTPNGQRTGSVKRASAKNRMTAAANQAVMLAARSRRATFSG